MYIIKSVKMYLILLLFLCCVVLIGCSNDPYIEADKDVIDSETLESWVGNYLFSEYAPPNQNLFYEISIYKEEDDYFAKISIDGFQTMKRLKTKVSGDENTIKLLFDKYLPDNLWESYDEGDILLSFEKRNSKLYTFWGEIQPILESNAKSDKIYFEVESQ